MHADEHVTAVEIGMGLRVDPFLVRPAEPVSTGKYGAGAARC
jgi:hypothetical protein